MTLLPWQHVPAISKKSKIHEFVAKGQQWQRWVVRRAVLNDLPSSSTSSSSSEAVEPQVVTFAKSGPLQSSPFLFLLLQSAIFMANQVMGEAATP